jgi:hypothetical protein
VRSSPALLDRFERTTRLAMFEPHVAKSPERAVSISALARVEFLHFFLVLDVLPPEVAFRGESVVRAATNNEIGHFIVAPKCASR